VVGPARLHVVDLLCDAAGGGGGDVSGAVRGCTTAAKGSSCGSCEWRWSWIIRGRPGG
jgi:hypothetical protein